MEFWGVEVKAGETFKVKVDNGDALKLSMGALGEFKNSKGNESITLFLNTEEVKKFVLGRLSTESVYHLSFDLVFNKDFELSHNWKNGSVYFSGYKTIIGVDTDHTDSDSGNELLPVSGGPEPSEKLNQTTKKVNAEKSKRKVAEDESEDSEDDSEEDDDSDDSGPEGVPMDVSGEDSSENDDSSDGEDDSSDGEDEETPKKAEPAKKRKADSASKTPVPEKRAKIVTPQKTGDSSKKGAVHVATPYPVKKSGKAPTTDKSKERSPKSAGQVACKPCNKSFNSESALQSHTKAKHSGGK